jgi:hypothetical protein
MTMVRYQPLMFLSSSIRGMESVRVRIREAVEALGLVESWLFEFHGPAAGGSAASQYLQYARACDVYVMVVGDEVRQGTLDEYSIALSDRPEKIMAFLVGADGHTEDFRSSLRRHRYLRVSRIEDVPKAVADSIVEFVRTGEIVRRSLLADLRDRLAAVRSFLGLPADFDFQTSIVDTDRALVTNDSLLEPDARSLITGSPGAGKTDRVLTALMSEREGFSPLPVLVQADSTGSVLAWIQAAFYSVKFNPGPKLVSQLLRDGRLAVAIDGVDELSSENYANAFGSIQRYASQYARSPFVVLSRFASTSSLPGFRRLTIVPLTDAQIDGLLQRLGEGAVTTHTLSTNTLDLARLPFWCALIAGVGPRGSSPIGLLNALVGRRLDEEAAGLAATQTRIALAYLAFLSSPGDRIAVSEAVDGLSAWLRSDEGRTSLGSRAAGSYIEAGRRAGILIRESGQLAFPHPMFAAFLAAEHCVRFRALPASLDDDAAAYIAALASRVDPALARQSLAHGSIFAVARYAGLSRSITPDVSQAENVARLNAMVHHLADKTLGGIPSRCHVSAVVSGDYFCVSVRPGDDAPTVTRIVSFSDWLRETGMPEAAFSCWKDPFAQFAPEAMAAQIATAAFKAAWRDLRPIGHEFAPPNSDMRPVVSDPDLDQRALAFVLRVRDERLALLDRLGLRGSRLDVTPGQPSIRLRVSTEEQAYMEVTWGANAATIERIQDGDRIGHSVSMLLADPSAVAYADLEDDIEAHLGSLVFSQANRRPVEPWSM